MTKALGKAEFVAALTEAAGNDSDGRALVEFIEECGMEVPIFRALDFVPELDEDAFSQRRAEAQRRADLLGIGDLPQIYAEYQALRQALLAGRGTLPHFCLALPEEWVTGQLALCPVSLDAQPYYLPGENLAGFAHQFRVDSGEVDVRCAYIAFTAVDCTPFWLGLAGLHAAYIARKNLEMSVGNSLTIRDGRALLQERLGERPPEWKPETIDWQIEGFLLTARWLDLRMRGEFRAIIDAFGLNRNATLASARSCSAFIVDQLGTLFPAPASELERKCREYLVMHSLFARVLPGAVLRKIYEHAGKASAPPFMDVTRKGCP